MWKVLVSLSGFILMNMTAFAQTVSLDDVGGYLGKVVTVFGKVNDAVYLRNSNNQPTLLNMGGKFPNQKLTVVIYGSSRADFGYKPEELLVDKNIYVTGKVDLYKGKPQILIQKPFDIAFSAPSRSTTASISSSTTTAQVDKREEKGKKDEIVQAENNKAASRKAETKVDRPSDRNKASVASTSEPTVKRGNVPQPMTEKPSELTINANVNLKAGPGQKFISVGNLRKGTAVTVLSSSYGWSKVVEKTPNQLKPLTGYVKTNRLQ